MRRTRDGRVNDKTVNGPGPLFLPSLPQTIDELEMEFNFLQSPVEHSGVDSTHLSGVMLEGTKLTTISLPTSLSTVHGEMANRQEILDRRQLAL